MLGAIAALLITLGAVVVATAPPQSFGWFAYAPPTDPLTDDVTLPVALPALPAVLDDHQMFVLLGGRHLLGLAALVTGLVLAGLAVGLRLGRRRAR